MFFLPLLLAGVHLGAFAFPMIRRLLELFSLYNVGLFVTTTLVSFGAFAPYDRLPSDGEGVLQHRERMIFFQRSGGRLRLLALNKS